MQTITLKALHHHGKEYLGIFFSSNKKLNTAIKKIPAIKWSRTNKCWYLALSRESYNIVTVATAGIATIETTQLKTYLTQKNKIAAVTATVQPQTGTPKKSQAISLSLSKISSSNLDAMAKFVQHLKLKAYSPSTIRTYRNEFAQLLQTIKQKPVNDLSADELKRYMLYAMEKEGISENTAHSRLNALHPVGLKN